MQSEIGFRENSSHATLLQTENGEEGHTAIVIKVAAVTVEVPVLAVRSDAKISVDLIQASGVSITELVRPLHRAAH